MKNIHFFLLLILLSSCRLFYPSPRVIESYDKKTIVKLLDYELFKDSIIVTIHKRGIYEIRVPLNKIDTFIVAKGRTSLQDYQKKYLKFKEELNDSAKSKIIELADDVVCLSRHSNWCDFYINDKKFFYSGEYLIYDSNTKSYIKEVQIIDKYYVDERYFGATFNVEVNKKTIYGYVVDS